MPVIEKKRTRDLPQINERIRFPKIRVIDTDGAQLGISYLRIDLGFPEFESCHLKDFSIKAQFL